MTPPTADGNPSKSRHTVFAYPPHSVEDVGRRLFDIKATMRAHIGDSDIITYTSDMDIIEVGFRNLMACIRRVRGLEEVSEILNYSDAFIGELLSFEEPTYRDVLYVVNNFFGKVVMNEGRKMFLVSGGESNPGPPKKSQRRSESRSSQSSSNASRQQSSGQDSRVKARQAPRRGGSEGSRLVEELVNQYHMTRYYEEGSSNLKTEQERVRFNHWVLLHRDEIDPKCGKFCNTCGQVALEICTHAMTHEEPEDPAVLFIVPTVVGWKFSHFYDWARDWIRAPQFDANLNRSPLIGGFSSAWIDQKLINEQMASYIRLHLNTSYKLNGEYCREAKVAHCHKLALRYCDEAKIEQTQRMSAAFVNSMQLTVARTADSGMEDMLYAEHDGVKNGLWKALNFCTARPHRKTLIIAGAVVLGMTSPNLRRKIITAVVKTKLFVFQKLYETNVDILLNGSMQALVSAVSQTRYLTVAIATNFWNLIVMHYYTAIRQSL